MILTRLYSAPKLSIKKGFYNICTKRVLLFYIKIILENAFMSLTDYVNFFPVYYPKTIFT